MTPLQLIESNPTLAEARELWMVMTVQIRDAMLAKQSTISTSHHISPIELTDGRWAVCCDLISEIRPGGVYYDVFQTLDLTALDTCEIVTTDEFNALKPTPQ
jgi:hypothetical protein